MVGGDDVEYGRGALGSAGGLAGDEGGFCGVLRGGDLGFWGGMWLVWVGWVGRGDGKRRGKGVRGGDVHTGGGRLGVIALVLSEKRWKSSVTLLAARAGSSFSKKLIQRWRSVLASWSFKQPCR